jgi:hypothetical protein
MAACGSSGSGSNPVASGPSPGFVRQMQNSAGCLDLVKVMQMAVSAKVFKFSTKDATALPDGKPVSASFNWMMGSIALELSQAKPDDQEKARGEIKKYLGSAKQNGCQSITGVDDDGKPTETKILDANPTRMAVALDHGTQAVYELASDHEMDMTESFQIPIPHSCGNPAQTVDEEHTLVTIEAFVWGDAPETPPRSANFDKLIRQGQTQGQSPNTQSDDEDYCKAVQPQ